MKKTIEVNVPTLDGLWETFPEEMQTDKLYADLSDAYNREINTLFRYSLSAERPQITMLTFSKHGSQWIADFTVKDLNLPVKDSFNFHFQNTSQWRYAGAIVIQNGVVSTHH